MPGKCVCGASTTVSVAELGDALQHAAVAMYPRCPTTCTTCFHIILKGTLPAEPILSVSAEDPPRPPTVPPSPATGQGPGQAPSGSLDNGSTAGSANNNSTEATVEDPDVEFAPLHRQVFASRKLARDAARTVDGWFVSIPGRQNVYACSCEGCDSKRYVQHDQVAGRWTIKQIGLCEHGTNSSYLECLSLHLPMPMTLKLKDLLQGNCPQRALALMREAFLADPVVGKMSAKWIANWNARRAPSPPSTKAEVEKWINELEEERIDDDLPYCFKESVANDGSTFLTCLLTANLIRNARRGRGEDFLSIDGQFSITVEGFIMQVLGTCDVPHHLLPVGVCVATSERKAVTATFLKAVHEEVQKDGSPWCPTKGMADLAGVDSTNAAHLWKETQNKTTRPLPKLQNPTHPLPPHWNMSQNPAHPLPLPWSMLLPQSQNPAHLLPLPWSMALHKFQNPAHPPPLRCTVHQSSQCLRICIGKPQRATKCVQCSLTTCVQGTRVVCIGVRCSRWRALSARSSGRLIRNPVLIPLQMCFLLRQLHGLLFIAFQVLIVHQRPLCIQTPTTKQQARKRPCAQLHR